MTNRVAKRFEELAKEATEIATTITRETSHKSTPMRRHDGTPVVHTFTTTTVDEHRLSKWGVSVRELLATVFGVEGQTFLQFAKVWDRLGVQAQSFDMSYPIFLSAKEQYDGGYIFDLRTLIQAEVFEDELEQAEHLLEGGYAVPAAVIAGVALETAMRKLCQQNGISLASKATINPMNDELAKAGIYNASKKKLITAWAGFRNDAAHGTAPVSKEDARQMIAGVREFLATVFT
jgi:hypothetical protein